MIRSILAVAAVALLATGAAAAPSHPLHKPAAKSARKAAPAHPATAPAGPSADTSDPAVMVAALQAAGAKAQATRKDPDGELVTVTSTFADFSIQYAQCDPQGRGCKAAVFDSQAAGAPSMAQINGFNQASAMCHGYMDKVGKSHVVASMLLFPDDTRQHLLTHLAAWQGCIAEFSNFARDPVAYLANAP